MSIVIKEVTDNKQLKAFIDLPYRLYKNHPYNVPPLRFDETATLRKDKNPAFDYCEAKYFLAYKGDRVVGRVAAILNHAFIDKWKEKYMRFGWIDFEEDIDIAAALIAEVEKWAREKGMDAVHGPLGFTDLDPEGMLVDGFDQLGTLAALYNYPYYPQYMEKLGYKKDIDWLEFKVPLGKEIPEHMIKLASVVENRYGLSVVKLKKAKDILPYAKELFELLNSSYSDLYGTVPLTERQMEYYTKQYFSFIKPEFVPMVKDREGKLVGFAITMPSLSIALQKAKGSLFPFGVFHILKAMGKNKIGDLYLIGVAKEYQGKGVNALLMLEVNKAFVKYGVESIETNYVLEDNLKVQAIFERYNGKPHKRRRCFIKKLND